MKVRSPVSKELHAGNCWKGDRNCYYTMTDWLHVATMGEVLFLGG